MIKGVNYIGVGIGAIIINKDKKFFLSKRGVKARNEKGKWEFPGGALEFGDTFANTIIREINEEFDIDIEIVDSLDPINHRIPDDKQHWVALCYVCKIKSGIPKIMEPDKCNEIGWFTLDAAKKLDLATYSQHRVKQLEKKYPDGLPDLYS